MNKTEEMAFLHPVQEVWGGIVRGCEWRQKLMGVWKTTCTERQAAGRKARKSATNILRHHGDFEKRSALQASETN